MLKLKRDEQLVNSFTLNGVAYYRLKMIDLNGSTRSSSVVSVQFGRTGIQVIPNPNNGTFQVTGLSGTNKLELSDLQGTVIQVQESNEETISFELGKEPGVYILRINGTKESEILRIIVN